MIAKLGKSKDIKANLINDGWRISDLDNIADIIGGGTPSSSDSAYWNGKINWFTPTEIGNEKYVYSSNRKITQEGLNSSSARILPIGTVLLTSRAGIGDVAITKSICTTNQGFQSLVAKNDVSNEFLYYLIQLLRPKLLEKASGSTFLEISPKQIKTIHCLIPPLEEQKAIARALSDVDELIQSVGKLIAKKKAIKEGAMQRLLTPPHKGGQRLPGFEGEWEEKKLGEITTIKRGGSPRPISDFITDSSDGINWIKIGDTSKYSKYIVSSEEKIIPEGEKYSRKVEVGDFLLSNSMSFGRPYILKINGCIHDGWLVIQDYKKTFDTEFMYYTLRTKYINDQYLAMAAGSGVLNLNKDILNKVTALFPSDIKEQKAIAQILSDMDLEIEKLQAQKAKYQKIKEGMMQELLTGKTRLV